jgi:hypothetical protein
MATRTHGDHPLDASLLERLAEVLSEAPGPIAQAETHERTSATQVGERDGYTLSCKPVVDGARKIGRITRKDAAREEDRVELRRDKVVIGDAVDAAIRGEDRWTQSTCRHSEPSYASLHSQ